MAFDQSLEALLKQSQLTKSFQKVAPPEHELLQEISFISPLYSIDPKQIIKGCWWISEITLAWSNADPFLGQSNPELNNISD